MLTVLVDRTESEVATVGFKVMIGLSVCQQSFSSRILLDAKNFPEYFCA